jgi:hypothetical protein
MDERFNGEYRTQYEALAADACGSCGSFPYECTSPPPLACHSRTKLLAFLSERGFTPIRIPPARIPCSYSSMRRSRMPHFVSAPINAPARPTAPAAVRAIAMGPAAKTPNTGTSKRVLTPASAGAIMPIVPPAALSVARLLGHEHVDVGVRITQPSCRPISTLGTFLWEQRPITARFGKNSSKIGCLRL